jgi:beta-glucanase (GH16 family)
MRAQIKRLLSLSILYLLLLNSSSFGQLKPAACVHSHGFQFLSDAMLGSIGACNCEKAPVFLDGLSGCTNGEYEIEFEDEFDGTKLDTSKWMSCPWGEGYMEGSSSTGINLLENVEIRDGICHAIAKKEQVVKRVISWKADNDILDDGQANLRKFDYTSVSLYTKRKFLYGKFEIRCKIPVGNGLWPAFWTYGGIRGNEIDFFDNYAGINTIVTSIGHNYDGLAKNSGCNDLQSGFDFSGWHTVTGIFDYDRLQFLVDDKLIRHVYRITSVTGQGINCGDNFEYGTYYQLKAFPIEPMYLIFSMGLSSIHGPGTNVDNSTPLPSSLEVDYVKVWVKKEKTINVYPIPAKDRLWIESTFNMMEVSAFDITGNLIRHWLINNSTAAFDVSDLTNGLYVFEFQYNGGTKYQKVAIVK